MIARKNIPRKISLRNTSTSGILMENVRHLTTEDKNPERAEAYVTFGCGQVQSGYFLDIAAGFQARTGCICVFCIEDSETIFLALEAISSEDISILYQDLEDPS